MLIFHNEKLGETSPAYMKSNQKFYIYKNSIAMGKKSVDNVKKILTQKIFFSILRKRYLM